MNLFDVFFIGIIGGLTPGPMTALLLGETLRQGRRHGMTIPIAMILSNSCFSLMALGLIVSGVGLEGFIAPLHFLGALVLFWFAFQDWKTADQTLALQTSVHSSLFSKALFMEFCNPHPYLFWGTVLTPSLLMTWKTENLFSVLNLCLFFILGLVGTKALMVLFAAPLQTRLSHQQRVFVNRSLAFMLFLFGLKLLLS